MLSASSVERKDLCAASREGDVALVSQLLANHPFDAVDATAALEGWYMMNPAIIRVLLHHGADVKAVSMRMIPCHDAPGELIRLLAEYKYDFKSDGHRILQLVSTTNLTKGGHTNSPQRLRPRPRNPRLAARPRCRHQPNRHPTARQRLQSRHRRDRQLVAPPQQRSSKGRHRAV